MLGRLGGRPPGAFQAAWAPTRALVSLLHSSPLLPSESAAAALQARVDLPSEPCICT